MSLNQRFSDLCVLVTGSTRGIGAQIARRFGAEGARVVVTGRSISSGKEVASQIVESGGNATYIEADLREPDDIDSLIDQTVAEHGAIDVLVNNAAVQTNTAVDAAGFEDWNAVVETDFRAYWLCAKEAASHMEAGSSIINVSSNHAFLTMPAHFPYNAVKSAINGMSRAMALDLGPEIRVNTINPGWIAVERTLRDLDDDALDDLESIHPTGRIGRPEDVAGVAAFLASEDAAFITGASITVDGGRCAVMQDDVLPDYSEPL